jgi:hypothetical protein
MILNPVTEHAVLQLLGVLYKVKIECLMEVMSTCDLLSEPKPLDRYAWNLLLEIFTESFQAVAVFSHIDL